MKIDPKMLVSDYDQTFYLNDEDIEKNKQAVAKFRKAGNIFVIATGRSYLDFFNKLEIYNFEYDYLIINHGATILDADNNILANFPMNNEIISKQTYGKIAYANYNNICEDNQICFLTLDEEKNEKSINASNINNRDDAINYLNSSYDSIKDQLKEITYTFKKDQSGNYYFYESNLKSLN